MEPADPVAAAMSELRPAVGEPTGTSSAGFPYLSRAAWVRVRDWVPHTLAEGSIAWEAAQRLADDEGAPEPALTVVRQIVRTAAITAPPDLWLLRQVVGAFAATGWRDRLAEGLHAPPPELEPDLTLLLARGYVVRTAGGGWRPAEEPTARRVWAELEPLPPRPADLARRWAAALAGDRADEPLLLDVLARPVPYAAHRAPAWVATPEDLEIGWRIVPLVLGLRRAERIAPSLAAGRLELDPGPLGDAVAATLWRAGWVDEHRVLTPVGRRALARGPGPFGIVEAYHPYLAELPRIWAEGRGAVHVARAANIAASQDANRQTFQRANDALDRYAADTGHRWSVVVEHAVGRGEALRQRWERDRLAGRTGVTYVAADLEEQAIAGAREEVAAGRLPPGLLFVQADIGRPEVLVDALRAAGLSPEGAVMLVGNGFHEVRLPAGARDDAMVEVFRGYERAGIVLLFTEESALSVDDLLETGWNTYHAGFRYVHERSGQGLRPAGPAPTPGLGPPLPLSWEECASRAGYARRERYGSRSRTIYPYPPANGHNPSVSANHFFVPRRLAGE